MDYRSGLTSFGNPNILYFADKDGNVTRLGPVSANTVADQYLVGQSGNDVLYSANSHVSNGCTSAVLGSVSLAVGGATVSTVELPAAKCSHIANMWADGQGAIRILVNTWDDAGANATVMPKPVLLEYRSGVVYSTDSPPVWESASNGRAVATITQSDEICGNLAIDAPGRPTLTDSEVCQVMATRRPPTASG